MRAMIRAKVELLRAEMNPDAQAEAHARAGQHDLATKIAERYLALYPGLGAWAGAVALGFGVLGDGMFNGNARIVIDGEAPGHPVHQLEPSESRRIAVDQLAAAGMGTVNQPSIGNEFGKHHRHGLEWELLDGFLYPGHSALRMHAVPEKTGRALMAAAMLMGGLALVPDQSLRALGAEVLVVSLATWSVFVRNQVKDRRREGYVPRRSTPW